jgi:TonB family protein
MKTFRFHSRAEQCVFAFMTTLLLSLPLHAEQRRTQSRVSPVYPSLARQMHVSGLVKVVVTIDPKGKVIRVKAVSGHPLLTAAAENAVMQWKFEPADTETETTIDVNFEMTW